VAQPRANNIDLDTSLQEMHGCAVSPDVRGNRFGSTIGSLFDDLSCIPANNFIDSESGQCYFCCASENWTVR
jgi:hypothetical protein